MEFLRQVCWLACWIGITIISAGVFLFIVVGIPMLIYNAVVKPRDPTFTLDYASVTAFNLSSGGHLTSFFDITFRANNPNHKLKLKYRDVRVLTYKDNQNLAVDALPGFTQHTRNVTIIRAEPAGLNVKLNKGPAFEVEFENGIGYLDFDVYMTARLNGRNLVVSCPYVVVNLTTPADHFIAASSPSYNDNNDGPKFQSRECSVLIYTEE